MKKHMVGLVVVFSGVVTRFELGKRTLQPQRAAVEEEVEAKVEVVGTVVAAAKKRLRRSLV